MTQMIKAQEGIITEEMLEVANTEEVSAEVIREGVAKGEIVIPANINRKDRGYVAIGTGLRTKVNASIGASKDYPDMEREKEKLQAALDAGADAIMDLSTGGNIDQIRINTLEIADVPVGTVPIYQAGIKSIDKYGSVVEMEAEDIFDEIERQAEAGVDFMAIHCGMTLEVLERLKNEGRVTDVVSRGGGFLTGWMLHHQKENPLYTQYDRVLEIAKKHDVTLSLGDGIRPGAVVDSLDRAQVQGLLVTGELVQRAREAGVQAMVEGPGHVPLDHIETTIQVQKELCHDAPFFVLGMLVTDIAAGYDHIVAAIGGAKATWAGADFVCYVTPAEHLGLPAKEDIKQGVIAARMATHAGDIAKYGSKASKLDTKMAEARVKEDWQEQAKLAINQEKVLAKSKGVKKEETRVMDEKAEPMELVANYLQG
ncbi:MULTISPECIES: phosphomethylpyrimidine synthase ThiC [unclassified Candidatus Frackibacter]|uniref:phosphomethylpyrimidine synthase ThiC n=1 Tax=unclassified Candidatus Frackibacter TaxID=2648818 RepID=UPI00088A051A|nr:MULTISPECIES: phosphomethylpyrimidine synthase ThiC [unclassified Candidatus Frackibacter]SDC34796.1 Radical SAM ThiC family protein [Candidatus Frackibacter sp. WG11]SEM56577.1 Radical SAM ThiC family protein [Candidatus Frackibacter sp. WG12]SFL70719.1 Radical SAM ThiC family protein [Candidatus Frackibacter sp. WG13]